MTWQSIGEAAQEVTSKPDIQDLYREAWRALCDREGHVSRLPGSDQRAEPRKKSGRRSSPAVAARDAEILALRESGVTAAEVGERFGMSTNAVWKATSRCRKKRRASQ